MKIDKPATIAYYFVWTGVALGLFLIVCFCQYSEYRAGQIVDETKQILAKMGEQNASAAMFVKTTVSQTSEVEETIKIGSLYTELIRTTDRQNLRLLASMIRQLIKMGPPMDPKTRKIHEAFLNGIDHAATLKN